MKVTSVKGSPEMLVELELRLEKLLQPTAKELLPLKPLWVDSLACLSLAFVRKTHPSMMALADQVTDLGNFALAVGYALAKHPDKFEDMISELKAKYGTEEIDVRDGAFG